MIDGVAADRNEGAFDRSHLVQVLDRKQFAADPNVEREQQCAQYSEWEPPVFDRYLPLLNLRK